MKYQVSSVRVGGLVDTNMREREPHITFLGVVKAPEDQNKKYFISAGHLSFIRKHDIETFDYPYIHGKSEFKLVDAVLNL